MTFIGLRSVNVARPTRLADRAGEVVLSAIDKQPVSEPTIAVSVLNLTGDDQADRTVHGGPDKAVYAYPVEHLIDWSSELGRPFGPGSFGENLSIEGLTERSARIGDRWAWGDVILEVCQPRWPCFKLTLHTGSVDVARRMRETGRTGWYLRVTHTGVAPVAGPIELALRDPRSVTVHAVHEAALPHSAISSDELAALLDHPALADGWKRMIASRHAPPT